MDWKREFELAQEKLEALKGENTTLRRQLIKSLKGSQEPSPDKMMDFIRRVSQRFNDEDLYQVVAEEFLLELGADRVTIMVQGGSEEANLVATHQACQKGVPQVGLPYFVSMEMEDPYRLYLNEVTESTKVHSQQWIECIQPHPEVAIIGARALCIDVPHEGKWIISLQWQDQFPDWEESSFSLFAEMADYTVTAIEQVQMFTQLRELKDQQGSLLNSMPSALIGLDFLGQVTMWNKQSELFFGIPESEAIGYNFGGLVPEFAEVSSNLFEFVSSNQKDLEEISFENIQGEIRHLKPYLFSLIDSDRGEIALRIDDITLQVEMQSKLMHIQKMETVGELAGEMADDFNKIIGGIGTTLSLVKSRWAEDVVKEQDQRDLDILFKFSDRAKDLVTRMIMLSKKGNSEVQDINLFLILENVFHLVSGSFDRNILVGLEAKAKEAVVWGDLNQIENSILNLCMNARDAMSGGGKLSIKLFPYIAEEPLLSKHSLIEKQGYWCVEVCDSGDGISLSEQVEIFKVFYTTKSKNGGTGLGLGLVEQVMQAHDGFVEVNSIEGKGSSFTLYFPARFEINQDEFWAAKTKVLLIEPDDVMAELAERLILELGGAVTRIKYGTDALHAYHIGESFDAILLSHKLLGLKAKQTIESIQQIEPKSKFIVLGEAIDGVDFPSLAYPLRLDRLKEALGLLQVNL